MKAKDIKKGLIYYECSSGINMELLAITNVSEVDVDINERIRKQWRWKSISKDFNIIDCCTTEGLEHYGPKIYDSPQYVSINHNAENDADKFTFEVI